jgi:hypothetical protein
VNGKQISKTERLRIHPLIRPPRAGRLGDPSLPRITSTIPQAANRRLSIISAGVPAILWLIP